MKNKVCILTSVHPPFDVRIFHKEAQSLVQADYNVTLIAQHDKDEIVDGVKILGLKKPRNRIERMIKTVSEVYQKALRVDADIYHFHDPELIPVGKALKKRGKAIIYDVHEDYYESIKLKKWLPTLIRRTVAELFSKYEISSSRKFDVIITATQMIESKFKAAKCNAKWISNYPRKDEFVFNTVAERLQHRKICFTGGINEVRAIYEMVSAAYIAKIPLILAGRFRSKALYEEMRLKPEWSIVEERGYVNRKEISKIYSQSMAGLILYHSHPTAPYSQPNKLFEYMAAGLPVIASNYELWRQIVEDNKCGICVNPLNVQEIAEAIIYIANHPEEARIMGQNGISAVEKTYNWANEEKKLLQVYGDIK